MTGGGRREHRTTSMPHMVELRAAARHLQLRVQDAHHHPRRPCVELACRVGSRTSRGSPAPLMMYHHQPRAPRGGSRLRKHRGAGRLLRRSSSTFLGWHLGVPGNGADGCGAGRVHGLGVWVNSAAETTPDGPRAVTPYTPTKPEEWVSGRIGAHGRARDAAAAGGPVALTPHLTSANRAGKGPVAGTWAAHRLVCAPPLPTPAALHGDVGALAEACQRSVRSAPRGGGGRAAWPSSGGGGHVAAQ